MARKSHNTLPDISATAGVSLSTVYRVLRGGRKIGNPVHERVYRLLRENGFVNAAASPLLLVEPQNLSRHAHLLSRAFVESCERDRIHLHRTDEKDLRSALEKFRPAGIVSLAELRELPPVPTVFLNCHSRRPETCEVAQNGQQNLTNLLRALLDAGYRRIGCFFPETETVAWNRSQGDVHPESAFRAAGLDPASGLIYRKNVTVATHFDDCVAAARHFLSLAPVPEVIALRSDTYMYAMTGYLGQCGSPLRLASADDSAYSSDADINFPEFRLAALGNLPAAAMADAALELVCAAVTRSDFTPRKIWFDSHIHIYRKADEK
ncbi:MAG: LacI family DNA-binding transcriptional regulator [Lentisphaeria bacterium]|nr:LacI family DNA-binding transcriptional regulator [Lentisphaeria bacterium]